MHSENKVINKLLDEGKIIQDEYNILFSSKKLWIDSSNKIEKFNKVLQKVINFQKNKEVLDLSYLEFPLFNFLDFKFNNNQSIDFNRSIFSHNTNFTECIFIENMYFKDVIFLGEVNFFKAHFIKEAYFFKAKFHKSTNFAWCKFNGECDFGWAIFFNKANFWEAIFSSEAYFWKTIFIKDAYLRGARFMSLADFTGLVFNKLDLTNIKFNDANFLDLIGLKGTIQILFNKNDNIYDNKIRDKILKYRTTLAKSHFSNKETARLIKAHFEKQNNITESNKYFNIEQELYIKHLRNTPTEPRRFGTLLALRINKLISNFGMSWFRAFISLVLISYIFMFGYIQLDGFLDLKDITIKHFISKDDLCYTILMIIGWFFFYLCTYIKILTDKILFWLTLAIGITIIIYNTNQYNDVLNYQNYLIQLTNPINAFKNMNLYNGIEIYGAFVRITVVTIIYQFIVAFRQNTRRK